jgi:GNAT superfamily N-acetyltransferase
MQAAPCDAREEQAKIVTLPSKPANLSASGDSRSRASRRADSIALRRADTPALVDLARTLFREYAQAIGVDLEYQGFAAELASLPGPYSAPNGALLIACARADAAGCAALRPLDASTAEMKRLYVRPQYRSIGLGARLVEAVIDAARQAGYHELRLDTLPTMAAAQALYRRFGFVEIPAYNDRHLPGTQFYARQLGR